MLVVNERVIAESIIELETKFSTDDRKSGSDPNWGEHLSKFRVVDDTPRIGKEKDVPSLGYEVLHVMQEHKEFLSDLNVKGLALENAALRVVVDSQTGCIASLYDKSTNFRRWNLEAAETSW